MGSCTDKAQNLRTRTARMDLDFSRLMELSARWNKLDIVAQIQHRTSKCKVVQSRGTTIYELANIIILVKTVKVEQEYCSPFEYYKYVRQGLYLQLLAASSKSLFLQ